MHDLVVIGAGPAGIAAAREARLQSVSCVVLERGVVADTVYRYPLATVLFSTSNEVEIERGALPSERKPTREEVLAHYNHVARREELGIRCGQEAVRIVKTAGGFNVKARDACYTGRTVLAAVGGFGRVRRLGVPGETPDRVSYRLIDPRAYQAARLLVVGGGNSAAEAALALSRVGATVTMCVRAASLDRKPDGKSTTAAIKQWVREPLERAAAEGLIRILTGAEVARVDAGSAVVRRVADSFQTIQCDHVFAMIGADPDTSLLEGAGASIARDGRPVYNPLTNETTVGGLFVAGHLTRERHIRNAVESARSVVRHIAAGPREGSRGYGCAQG